jgi:hypothetical protein
MSYCRWSSDNWKCDLYCYEEVSGGFTTHVASNRIVGEVPEASFALLQKNDDLSVPEQVMRRLRNEAFKEWTEAQEKQSKFLDTCKHKPIGLPYDGESFNDPDLESFLKRLLHLREVGYKFPDYVLEEVKEEIEDARKRKTGS